MQSSFFRLSFQGIFKEPIHTYDSTYNIPYLDSVSVSSRYDHTHPYISNVKKKSFLGLIYVPRNILFVTSTGAFT